MKVLKILAALSLVLLLTVGGYVSYLFISYKRLPDHQELSVAAPVENLATTGESIKVASWNMGFGAYVKDYSFFMDGGNESRVRSKEDVYNNIGAMAKILQDIGADIMMLQELDVDATRSYHVDETALLMNEMTDYSAVFAQNYDSAYLFYPLTQPHGASKAGMLTLSRYRIISALRRSLPVETGITKFFDLDRCYSISRISVENGKTLCLYNIHLSAYTSDGTIVIEQMERLMEDIAGEYAAGNYIVVGGDFNKDLLNDSSQIFGVSGEEYTWAQPLPFEMIPEGFSLVSSLDKNNPVPSCRNADKPYVEGESFVLMVDGFIVSDNIKVNDCRVWDAGFEYSDHNPVVMEIELMEID